MRSRYSYSQDYVRFFLHRNKLQTADDPSELTRATVSDPRIAQMLSDLADWPNPQIKNHKDVDHPLHKLSFLAELGFTNRDPPIKPILDKVVHYQSDEGPFQLLINIPKAFGGPGQPLLSWVMSDAPVLLYALIRLNNGKITPSVSKESTSSRTLFPKTDGTASHPKNWASFTDLAERTTRVRMQRCSHSRCWPTQTRVSIRPPRQQGSRHCSIYGEASQPKGRIYSAWEQSL